jgi:hypothetical protein
MDADHIHIINLSKHKTDIETYIFIETLSKDILLPIKDRDFLIYAIVLTRLADKSKWIKRQDIDCYMSNTEREWIINYLDRIEVNDTYKTYIKSILEYFLSITYPSIMASSTLTQQINQVIDTIHARLMMNDQTIISADNLEMPEDPNPQSTSEPSSPTPQSQQPPKYEDEPTILPSYIKHALVYSKPGNNRYIFDGISYHFTFHSMIINNEWCYNIRYIFVGRHENVSPSFRIYRFNPVEKQLEHIFPNAFEHLIPVKPEWEVFMIPTNDDANLFYYIQKCENEYQYLHIITRDGLALWSINAWGIMHVITLRNNMCAVFTHSKKVKNEFIFTCHFHDITTGRLYKSITHKKILNIHYSEEIDQFYQIIGNTIRFLDLELNEIDSAKIVLDYKYEMYDALNGILVHQK